MRGVHGGHRIPSDGVKLSQKGMDVERRGGLIDLEEGGPVGGGGRHLIDVVGYVVQEGLEEGAPGLRALLIPPVQQGFRLFSRVFLLPFQHLERPVIFTLHDYAKLPLLEATAGEDREV